MCENLRLHWKNIFLSQERNIVVIVALGWDFSHQSSNVYKTEHMVFALAGLKFKLSCKSVNISWCRCQPALSDGSPDALLSIQWQTSYEATCSKWFNLPPSSSFSCYFSIYQSCLLLLMPSLFCEGILLLWFDFPHFHIACNIFSIL